ncbi:hypothetical protein GGTG_10972 [Gaeumannomyces tritici R3-111a-1]|uniref:DUF1996 domain-containing protein n=1 Tax=Gaeumannomyces tritici (strain R3-111a-1) TaxID=644352 RepID=J3PBV0_GAET3|nr:hypothetical protein GGTG_10972 [Gaeumannomyces tritici R3-111a-1]EJT71718.1 hypothetical protein GGTG_10972 [Gaeumannomyces tritici R3-111a-1]
MGLLTLTMLAAILGVSEAAARFGCSTVSVQRLDPLVEPGNIPSAHVHQIVGGDAFNATMDPNIDISQTSTCKTCEFLENRSNYWTAVPYFGARNGSYHCVSQYPNAYHDPQVGGMTVYYTQESFFSNGRNKITAFKPGFRMAVGDPGTTARQVAKSHPGLLYVCLQNVMTRFPEAPDFHTRPCPGGIMAVHHFPACWDGKNLDSRDHHLHMVSTAGEAFAVPRPCPASHPVRMPQLALEAMWDTAPFNDRSLWPEDGGQPFVWSHDDRLGYGTHADYVFGWQGDALQRAMDSPCMFRACGAAGGPLTIQRRGAKNECNVKSTVTEQIDGWLDRLPGR